MDKIQIEGQKKIEGKIKISGSKKFIPTNIIGFLLSNNKVKIKNVPRLSDVFNDKDIRIIKLNNIFK